jgi:O-antigen chain-terminating methyltransferase
VAFFESYIRDLTHVRPLHPETMQYLLRVSGFSHVRVEYSSPVSAAGRLAPLAVDPASIDDPLLRHVVETVDGNTSALNSRLFGYQDYAVIGRK